MNHFGPIGTMVAGAVLITINRRSRRPAGAAERRAAWRLLWDLGRGAASLVVFAAWMLAPRHVMPGQRIPRPRARRMVRAMSPARARRMTRKGGRS